MDLDKITGWCIVLANTDKFYSNYCCPSVCRQRSFKASMTTTDIKVLNVPQLLWRAFGPLCKAILPSTVKTVIAACWPKPYDQISVHLEGAWLAGTMCWWSQTCFPTTPYYPERNGQCERFNQTLDELLRILPEEKKNKWLQHLSQVLYV